MKTEKIAHARRYADQLARAHPEIAGIVLGGLVARGNDLSISDIDLWCFVDHDTPSLPIRTHHVGDLYVDVELYPAAILVEADLAEDAYIRPEYPHHGSWRRSVLNVRSSKSTFRARRPSL